MDNWDDLKLILALSRYGTMSAAAQALNMSVATVSRRLERCAESIGKTLFVRRGQVWKPTAIALIFVELAEGVIEGFPHDGQPIPKDGLAHRVLKMAAPLDVCMDALARHVPAFLTKNPGITIETFNEPKSVAFGEVDIRLSYRQPAEGRLVRLRLGSVGYRVYVGDQNTQEPNGWVQILNAERESSQLDEVLRDQFGPPKLKSTSVSCALELAKKMPLVVHLPTRLAELTPGLKPWYPSRPTSYFPVWAVYHESRRLDPDVRLSLSFVRSCFVG